MRCEHNYIKPYHIKNHLEKWLPRSVTTESQKHWVQFVIYNRYYYGSQAHAKCQLNYITNGYA